MPRLWMVPTSHLCRQHLLGEHHETHVFYGALKRRRSMTGYIASNLFSVIDLWPRHEALAAELLLRGGTHSSPFPPEFHIRELGEYIEPHPPVNRDWAAGELYRRCPLCRQRASELAPT